MLEQRKTELERRCEAVILKLLRAEFECRRQLDDLGELGLEIRGPVTGEFSFGNASPFHLALDLIGVPPDNTVQNVEKYGYPKGFKVPDTFCRDWLSDIWDRVVKSGSHQELSRFVREVRKELEKLRKEYESN